MTTKVVGGGVAQQIFVKLDMQLTWLVQAATRQGRVNAALFGRTSLLDELRKYVQKACDGELAVALSGESKEEEEHDPMNDVDVSHTESPSKGRLNDLLREYRISDRKPNRKFKVPRWVLAERLEIWWLNVFKLRKLVQLHFGYDPVARILINTSALDHSNAIHCKPCVCVFWFAVFNVVFLFMFDVQSWGPCLYNERNVDQSPFHSNEAGSQEVGTLALKGAPTVPLIENHAATRERMSLNSVTDSSPERIRRRLPGFELMFRADGKQVEDKLQQHLFGKPSLPFRVTVVTGPSGSYKEEDILNFLEKHLEQWTPDRQWEFMFLDAYAPGLTNNVLTQP